MVGCKLLVSHIPDRGESMSQLCVLPFSSVTFLVHARVLKFIFLKSDFLLLTFAWGALTLFCFLAFFCFAPWFYSQLHTKLYIILK